MLEDVRFKGNPLNNTDRMSNIRVMFIAKIENLVMFNRTKVGVTVRGERAFCELDYLKMNGAEWLKVDKKDKEQMLKFNRAHPRYLYFVKSNFSTNYSIFFIFLN